MQPSFPKRSQPSGEAERYAPRVTVATLVERDGRFLFVEERISGKLVINQPAGHLDPDESIVQAAVRETLEETGWTVQIDALVAIDQYEAADRAFLRFAFAATALHHDVELTLDTGIERAVWLTRAELIARTSEHRSALVLAGVDAYLTGVRVPTSLLRMVTAQGVLK
jgi:8-oxo-dGTP pyrophosphatase MutT (NUDIX family)